MVPREEAIRIALVGDIALGDHPKTPGFGFYSRYRRGIPPNLAQRTVSPGPVPDLTIGNLEFSLATGPGKIPADTCCLGSGSFVSFLKVTGITVLNMANNHAWQFGPEVFRGTVRLLQQAGIKVVGIADDFDPASFLRIRGQTVAILGCSERPRQGFTEAPDYNEFDEVSFLERIREARRHSDLVCVSIHSGEEFVGIASQRERAVARAMIDAGAAVILGHHPHVLKEVEQYRGGIIAYSMGNFIGDMLWNTATRETGCLVLVADGSHICSQAFFPAIIERDYFPRFLSDAESTRFMEDQKRKQARLQKHSEVVGYEVIAREALRRHQWLTVGFLLRNLFRYRLETLIQIASHAIRDRLQVRPE